MRSLCFVLGLVAACSGGGDGRHPAMPAEAGGSSTGGSRARAGSASQQAGEGGDANEGGAGAALAGEAGQGIVYETAGAPPVGPPGVCDPQLELGDEQAQNLAVSGVTLLSMTPDERSVAFLTGTGDSALLYVADRASTSAAFMELAVTLPDGYEATRGVSLSADGKLLIVARQDRAGFGELERSGRGQPFGADANQTRFALINSLKAMSGRSAGWPVVSSDGQAFYFLSYFGQGLVVQSALGKDGAFDFGTEIDPFTLGGLEGEYKLISGLSPDQRAIFFFDEQSGHAMALFRSHDGAPFYDPLDLGERQGVVPNQDCSRVYSSVPSGLVVQTQQ